MKVPMTPMGKALHRNQSRTSRANTPGTASRGWPPRVATPTMGRRVRCASSMPLPAAAGPPSTAPSRTGSRILVPSAWLSSIRTAPDAAQAPTRISDWRPPSRSAASRCALVGGCPGTNHCRVGGQGQCSGNRDADDPQHHQDRHHRQVSLGEVDVGVTAQWDQDRRCINDGDEVGQGEVERVLQ